jgi:DNA invertase Pin-like site-specific DNA recombinase
VRPRAVGYIRVSSQSQLDGYGLKAQEQDVRKCAKAHSLKLLAIFRDEGVSGSTEAMDRPGLADALARLEGREAEVLLVPRLDRLARKLTIQEAALAQAWKHGGRVIACDQGEVERDEPDDPVRTAMRQMMGVFAQLERGMVVARLRRGRQAKKDAGGYAFGRPPYGFRASSGALVSVPEEQSIIDEAERLREAGQSYRQIAARLDAEGHRPRSGGVWHPTTVARIVAIGASRSHMPKR